jgi:thiosulfate dehydrogenase [quinone] large subunit
MLAPLRLFLGVTFCYAGVQKLTDPQYFQPAARGSIGELIAAFASGSPLHDLLVTIALPHATFFGALIAYGELAIGLGVLAGLLLRVASLCGLLLNLLFFLSADWHIFPYFYGSDIVFLFCWLTLLLAGPAQQALPALDTWLVLWLVQRASPPKRQCLAALCALVSGVQVAPGLQDAQARPPASSYPPAGHTEQRQRTGRRAFLWGTAGGSGLMLVLVGLAETLHLLPARSPDTGELQLTPTPGPPIDDTPVVAHRGSVIAHINAVPPNSSTTFTIPTNGAPGILVRLGNGQFVAFNAICTHAGCPVDYDTALRDLICPCHGAAFDPAHGASVINGPAQFPLPGVPISVDQQAGTVSLSL